MKQLRKIPALFLALLILAGAGRAESFKPADGEWGAERNTVFELPVPAGFSRKDEGETKGQGSIIRWERWENEDGTEYVYTDVTSYRKVFSVEPDQISALYDSQTEGMEGIAWQQDITLDDGRTARVLATTGIQTDEDGTEHAEIRIRLLYFLGSNMLNLIYGTLAEPGAAADNSRIPAVRDWEPILAQVHYSVPEGREGLPEWLVTLNSFICTLETKDGQLAVTDGKKLTIIARQQEADLIRSMDEQATKMTWVLADAETWAREGRLEKVDGSVAKIDSRGGLTGGNVTDITVVKVLAYNQTSGYIASANYLIVPKQKELRLDEQKIMLYEGESGPFLLTVSAEPENSRLFSTTYTNISWKVNDPKVLEIEDKGDGKATIIPLKAGEATVTVSDSVSGKTAKANVTVLTPVTGVTITGPDSLQAGKSATYKATLSPEKPSRRKVTWTLEEGEEFATISEEGRLSIRKDAPAGSKIVIKCQAVCSSMERADLKTVIVDP